MDHQDEKLGVEFYKKLWQNPFKSIEEGRPIFEEKEWVRILIPGNQHSTIDTLAEDVYKMRFKEAYAQFQKAQTGEQGVSGTPLSSWSSISRESAEKLRYFHFFTVEQVASASDAQLQTIGMEAGMSPHELRKLAQAYLESSAKTSDIMKRNAELDLLRSDNDDLRSQNITQAQQIAELQKQMQVLITANAQATQAKPTRRKTADKNPTQLEE